MADMADVLADYSGLSWSQLATKLDLKSVDCEDVIAVVEEDNKSDTDSMKLKKEEMTLYGLCPAQDEFFLVICECCHLLIKPQALQYHMDVRHQNYSNSHVHNCAIPLCTIDPISARNTKCSSHKTNSSVSAQSASSQAGRSCASKPVKGRPAKAKVQPTAKEVAKTCTERPKLNSSATQFSSASESNSVLQKGDAKRLSTSVGALESKVPNVILDKKVESVLSSSVQDDSFGKADIKMESKDFDDPVVLEPSHLKISEEKEALVKLLESNEWRDFDIKQEKEEKVSNANYPFSELNQSNCQISRTHDTGTYASSVDSSLVTVVKTLTSTTTTCSMSKSTSPLVISSGMGSGASRGLLKSNVKCSSDSRAHVISAETPLTNDCSHSNLNETDGNGASGGLAKLSETSALNAGLSKVQGAVKLEVKAPLQTQDSIDKETEPLKNCRSVSNVISKVPLKPSKGRKASPKFLLCKDREFDPNKHCGVWIEDIQKQCTRSLTCKSHSLSLRRAVLGRIKAFDQLLNEQRERKTLAKDKSAKSITKLKDKSAVAAPNEAETVSTNGITSSSSSSSKTLNANTSSTAPSSNAAFSSAMTTGSEHQLLNQTAAVGQHCDKIERSVVFTNLTRPVKSFTSSNEDSVMPGLREEAADAGGTGGAAASEKANVESSGRCFLSHHPHPSAVNGFNSWLYGRGCYVFSRKEDLIRATFLAAVEKHVNPAPYKKLCLESKLTTDAATTGNNKDPYDFILPDGIKYRAQLSSPLPSQSTKPKVKQISPSALVDQRNCSTSSSLAPNSGKRPSSDVLENKRKVLKMDQMSSSEEVLSKVAMMSTVAASKSVDVISSSVTVQESVNSSSTQLLSNRLESSALLNGQVMALSAAEMLLTSSHRSQPAELRLSQSLLPQSNKITQKTGQTLSKTVPTASSKTLPLSAKVVPGLTFAQNASVRLELRPAAADVNRIAIAESNVVSLISDPNRPILSRDCFSVKAPSTSSIAGNSLLRPNASIGTANKIPNIVLAPPMPNGTLKVAPRGATIKSITNSSSQPSLAAILGLKQEAASKLTTLAESQAFISANLSSLGKTNQIAAASLSSEASKQLSHNLPPANASSSTVQVHATLTMPMSQAGMRTGFSAASTGVSVGSKQYFLASNVRHVYSTPLSSTPKKPIATGRVQVLRPDLAPSSKTAPSTAALVAGSKCQLSGQPI